MGDRLLELRESVRKATGPDVKLDWAIAEALGGEALQLEICATYSATLTASLDSALSLVEKVLPERSWPLMHMATLIAMQWSVDRHPPGKPGLLSAYLARALVHELLSALIDQEKSKEVGNG